MTPLPEAVMRRHGSLVAWRLDAKEHAAAWDAGEGARLVGGRWNSKGMRAVYASLDPATCILEVAAHVGMPDFERAPRVLTSFVIKDAAAVHILRPGDLPDERWLEYAPPSPLQQRFGDQLLTRHAFFLAPSVVSKHSWNLIFNPERAKDGYALASQESFMLDPRLYPTAR